MKDRSYSLQDPPIHNAHGGIDCHGCIGCIVKDKWQRHPKWYDGSCLGECKRLINQTARERKIAHRESGIIIAGHEGSWHIIDTAVDVVGKTMYLLEHEQLGDCAAGLIVDSHGEVLMDEVYNGFDDYWEAAK